MEFINFKIIFLDTKKAFDPKLKTLIKEYPNLFNAYVKLGEQFLQVFNYFFKNLMIL